MILIAKRFVRLAIAALLLPSMFLAMPAAATSSAGGGQAKVFMGFGDSVAAGFGLPVVDPTMGFDAACGRSYAAYVNEAAAALNAQAVNLACTGATTWHGILGTQETAVGDVPSQLRQAVAGPRPYYASVTVGANDIQWTTFLAQCIQSNCATDANTKAFRALLAKAKVGLSASLTGIQYVGARKVLVTGYYDPFAGNAAVAGQFGLDAEEVAWYQARLAELNGAIAKTAGHFSRATYVPVTFQDPSLIILDPANPGIFHPTAAGQKAISQAIVTAAQ